MKQDHPRFADTLTPLEETRYRYRDTSVSREEGEFLWNLIRENRYQKTIEIGCALGISSLYICDAVSQFSNPSHTIIDPKQTTAWSSIGIRNLRAHSIDFYSLIEEPSEFALPKLLEKKETFDFAFIDGWHTFDHSLLDFFYLNRLIRVGGMVVFDDANWPSVSKLLGYLSRYPAYEIVVPSKNAIKPPNLTWRQRLFRMLCYGARTIPEGIRKEIFSERVLSGRIRKTERPSIVGLKKVAEDERKWDWYEPF
jgi:predicted O-methyltransferase YrrM